MMKKEYREFPKKLTIRLTRFNPRQFVITNFLHRFTKSLRKVMCFKRKVLF